MRKKKDEPVDFGKVLFDKLKSHDLFLFPRLGCTRDQVEEIRVKQGVERLPETYRQFLSAFGRGGFEGIWGGSEFRYPDLLEIKKWALRLIEKNKRLAAK